jgi:hypothetical protein
VGEGLGDHGGMFDGARGLLYYALTRGDARLFLTGPSMRGHHQIEIACAVCHTEPYGSDAVCSRPPSSATARRSITGRALWLFPMLLRFHILAVYCY